MSTNHVLRAQFGEKSKIENAQTQWNMVKSRLFRIVEWQSPAVSRDTDSKFCVHFHRQMFFHKC